MSPERTVCDVRWLVTEPREPARTAADLALLSADERARHDRFVFARDRRDYAAAHALLRLSLSRHGGRPPEAWRFVSTGRGKPCLAPPFPEGPRLSFNLAHSRGLVALVVARGAEAGIDVERTDRATDAMALATRFFSAAELQALESLPPERRAGQFTVLWTLKEAFLKALGVGLAGSLSAVSFNLREPGAVGVSLPADLRHETWQFAVYAPGDAHLMAIALRAGAGARLPSDLLEVAAFQAEASPPGAPLLPLRVSWR